MKKEIPAWRIALSVILIAYSAFRLISHFTKKQNENYNFTPISTYNNNNIYSGNDNLLSTPKVYTNDKMYMPYKSLDSLPKETLNLYKITKVKTDSIYKFDIVSNIVLTKGEYIQNNHDDSLKFAIKTPEDLNIFIHEFTTHDSIPACFKSIKKNCKIDKLEFKTDKDVTYITYNITKDHKKFNGYAMATYQGKELLVFEFESIKQTSALLMIEALIFLQTKIKGNDLHKK